MGVGQTVKFKAKVVPELSGSFTWSTESNLIDLDDATTTSQVVSLTAGDAYSELDAVEIKVVFSPYDSDYFEIENKHQFTILKLGLEPINSGNTPELPPGLICLNEQNEYAKSRWKATVKPNGVVARVVTKTDNVQLTTGDFTLVQDESEFTVEKTEIGNYTLEVFKYLYPHISSLESSTVFVVSPIKFQNSAMEANWKSIDEDFQHLGVYTGQSATFAVDVLPIGFTLPNDVFSWEGLASGAGAETIVTFSTPNFMSEVSITFGGTTKVANVAIRDQPTGIGEIAYAALHSVYTAIALSKNLIGTDASQLEPFIWANETYPGNQHNTIADAARHAYWTCLLTRYTVAGYALGLSTQHEVSAPGPATETVMDLHNNLIGIAVEDGHTHTPGLECCRSAVQAAISSGTMWYLDSSYGRENVREDALLQPTDQ